MKDKVTIYDVAKKMNVSTATVNRALNGKPKVGEETRRRVIEVAMDMGYKANKAAMSLSRKTIKIGFIIDNLIHDFNKKTTEGARKALEELSDFNVTASFYVLDKTLNWEEGIQLMRNMAEEGYAGIIVTASAMYNQAIDELCKKNIPVVTVISDSPGSKRLFSVRTNGFVSGKIAAELLYYYVKDKPVAILTGYKDFGVHKENIDGFRQQLLSTPLDLVAVYENYDDPVIAYHTTDKLLRDYPNIGGIYIATSNSITVCNRLVELGMKDKIKIVASDVFPQLVSNMKNGVINATIYQQPYDIGYIAFKYLYDYITEGRCIDSEVLLPPQIVLSSNLELY